MFLCLPNFINFNFFCVFIWSIKDLGVIDLGLYPTGLDRTLTLSCLYNLKFSFSFDKWKINIYLRVRIIIQLNNVCWMIIPVPSIEIINVYFLLFLLTSCGGVERFMWTCVLVYLHMWVCAYMCTWRSKTDSGVIFQLLAYFPHHFALFFIVWKHDLPVVRNSPCSVGKSGWPTNPAVHLFLFPQHQDYKLANWSAFLCGFWQSNADSAVYTVITL